MKKVPQMMKSVIVSSNSAGSSRLMSARVCRCRSAEYSKLRRAVVTDGCSKCTLESVNDEEETPERGPSCEDPQGRVVKSLLFWGYIFYRFTPVSRMRSKASRADRGRSGLTPRSPWIRLALACTARPRSSQPDACRLRLALKS